MPAKVPLQDVDAKYLKIISEFAIDMLSLSGVDEILWHLAQNVVSQLGFDDVVVYLLDPARGVLMQKASFGDKNPSGHEILAPIELKLGEGVVGTVAKTKQPLLVGDTRQFPNYIVDDAPRLSELAVPMLMDGELIGVIDTEHPKKNFYTSQHERILFALASIAALKIHRANNLVTLQKRVADLEYASKIQDTLFAIAEIIFETDSIKAFYQRLHACIARLIKADNFYVALLSEDGQRLHFPYHVDQYDQLAEDTELPLLPSCLGITAYTLLRNNPLLVDEAQIKALVDQGEITINGAMPRAWLGVPFGDEAFRGILVVQSYQGGYRYSDADQRLLVFCAKHIRNAISRMNVKANLTQMALYDGLTKLPNRMLFIDRLNQAIAKLNEAAENGVSAKGLGLVLLDIDHFKAVNDTYGHHLGDELLKVFAQRTEAAIASQDTICRLGGDQFGLLLMGIDSESECLARVEALREQMQAVLDLGGISIALSVSLGLVTCFSSGMRASDLLRRGDQALLRAKLMGRQRLCVFSSGEQTELQETQICQEFQQAAAQEELYFSFQPQYRLKDGKLIGAEALLRWEHPRYGIISPRRLLAPLRRQGALQLVDAVVARLILAHLKRYHGTYPEDFRVSVNLASDGSALFDELEGMVTKGEDLAKFLGLEIPEASIVAGFDKVKHCIARAKSLGVLVSLDDAGASHASFGYLQTLRFDRLKIAQGLISPMKMAYDNQMILETIINLASSLNIDTLAQGIETREQYQTLLLFGCDYGQGEFMNPSVSEEKLLLMLTQSPFFR
ncbi:EAL domain-containing protein [Shewanella sp. Isolate8]|uniref:EAL domain-containing protein n=1 Tax=Shewanella sp. Isolate8 TaxID=2908529 RepID=UPI001EFDF4C7|nr:EAL domain-containing protein [Shewanella sp. Isolate8]MCG9746368.1 EAL domain-containing protein [Shewanella sp. Isolate8]